MTEAEKGVILRELSPDWQGNSGFARAVACTEQTKPREGHCPARGWKETVAADPQRRTFSYRVKNTAIPPLGNPTPPPLAEVLVNGEKTKPPPVIIECELLPAGTFAASVREAPFTTVTAGLKGTAALPPAHEVALDVMRLVPRNQLPDPAS